MENIDEKAISVVETKPLALKLTEVAIETIQHNIQMAEKLVMNVLEKDVDYGRTPGTPQDGLWDPGASKIMSAFNSYADHKVLYHQEDDSIISWTIQANIINRDTQQVVGTGLGACSTKETKYKYRWVFDPQNYGYSREEIKTFKVNKDGKYRIPNPEYGELVNTLLQMAAKRSECDAAKSLPGVGSALRKLFSPAPRKEPDWASFWGRITQMGLSEQKVHEMLGVTSVNQWMAQGKTLDEAIKIIANKLTRLASEASTGAEKPKPVISPYFAPVIEPTEDLFPPEEVTPGPAETPPKPKRDPVTIKTIAQLFRACYQDWNLQPQQVIKELGYSAQSEISELPSECYLQLCAARGVECQK